MRLDDPKAKGNKQHDLTLFLSGTKKETRGLCFPCLIERMNISASSETCVTGSGQHENFLRRFIVQTHMLDLLFDFYYPFLQSLSLCKPWWG